MRTPGATQLAVWLVIGVGALTFLKWSNDNLDADSPRPAPFLLDSAPPTIRVDSLPKPFASLKAPVMRLPLKRLPRTQTTKLRAEPGQPVQVSITAYCLQGRTRTGTRVRDGIVAADPRVFPLNTEIDLIVAGDTLGRFRVEDTGLLIKGRKLDMWLEDCSEARSFGRKKGQATLAAKIHR